MGRIPAFLALTLTGCGQDTPDAAGRARTLAMGDSILAWNGASGRSVADEVQRQTGRRGGR